ncbi:hypothetical protein [Calycomorphotria hydatis]|uniref:Uncharacterized protein n=1 Tax=Calycomorphotria hydatis TaxID=2528027 RepID=A0A517T8J1_9PLAN|nr:hypothetical protein [Calycomorphotria hydatis]QDT64704.1 hypothetical protein V22_19450 [Calycomorphotria hydatis]
MKELELANKLEKYFYERVLETGRYTVNLRLVQKWKLVLATERPRSDSVIELLSLLDSDEVTPGTAQDEVDVCMRKWAARILDSELK